MVSHVSRVRWAASGFDKDIRQVTVLAEISFGLLYIFWDSALNSVTSWPLYMRIVRSLRHPPTGARGAAVAIGNFDGVHRGHRAVVEAAVKAAAELSIPPAVLTFEPHPRTLFQPDVPPFRLTPLRTKAVHLREAGIEILYLARFDRAFSALSAEEFVRVVLVGGIATRHVVAGYDFVFGRGGGGDAELLERLAKVHNFGVTIVEAVGGGETKQPFASRRVRAALIDGDVAAAAEVLGHWWEISGRVRHGAKRGKGLGYPTANLHLRDLLVPKFGIYAVWIRLGGEANWRSAVASLGIRPTFDGSEALLEVHIFDFDNNLYGQPVCVALVAYLRPERKFKTSAALRAAMDQDALRARAILASPAAAPSGSRY